MRERGWMPERLRRWVPPAVLEDTGWPFPWRPLRSSCYQSANGGFAWSPATEVHETLDAFIVRADLPGMRREDISVSLLSTTLTIQGERQPPLDINPKMEGVNSSELCYGRFSRSIVLPDNIQSDRIEATYTNGVLEVRVAKLPGAKPTRIEVKPGNVQGGL